jgi:uncharacterized protein YjbJ (UPF0337 family)
MGLFDAVREKAAELLSGAGDKVSELTGTDLADTQQNVTEGAQGYADQAQGAAEGYTDQAQGYADQAQGAADGYADQAQGYADQATAAGQDLTGTATDAAQNVTDSVVDPAIGQYVDPRGQQ